MICMMEMTVLVGFVARMRPGEDAFGWRDRITEHNPRQDPAMCASEQQARPVVVRDGPVDACAFDRLARRARFR